jgi:hypothetical protein
LAARVLARVDGWRRNPERREVRRDCYYFPVSPKRWVPYIEPFAKKWERYVRPYRWDKYVRPHLPKEEEKENNKEDDKKEEVGLSPELEELKRRLERLKEELSEDQRK